MTLRGTFDEAPELYDRVRPGYPEVFEDLARLARLRPGSRVLELGCGTGQATVPLATRGFEVVAVELGAGLAKVARRNLASFPAVDIINAAFEEWPLPPAPFDAGRGRDVVSLAGPPRSGTALLRDVDAGHAEGSTTPERQRRTPPRQRRLRGQRHFAKVLFRRYERELTYTTREYLDLLLSYSNHRALASDARDGLLACIGELIDTRFGGRIAKRYMTELTVVYRRPSE